MWLFALGLQRSSNSAFRFRRCKKVYFNTIQSLLFVMATLCSRHGDEREVQMMLNVFEICRPENRAIAREWDESVVRRLPATVSCLVLAHTVSPSQTCQIGHSPITESHCADWNKVVLMLAFLYSTEV